MLRKYPIFFVLLGILAAVLYAADSSSVFRTNVDLVEVSFVATDDSGKYVPGLHADDLRVLEDGQPQTIRSFIDGGADSDDERSAAIIYILFDTSNSMYVGFPQTEDAIADFIRSTNHADRIAINSFSRNMLRLSPLSSDHQVALRNLRQAIAGDDTALYNALLLTIRDVAHAPGRKAIVVFSNAADRASTLSPDDVGRVAEREGVPIYLFERGPESPISLEAMQSLARQTGGKVYRTHSPNQQTEAFTAVRDDLAHSYLLTYTPQPNANRGFRKIELQTPGRTCHIRARTGYTLP